MFRSWYIWPTYHTHPVKEGVVWKIQIRCKFWISHGGVCERVGILQIRPLNLDLPTDFITHTLTILHTFLSGCVNTLTYSASKKFCCSVQCILLLYRPMLEVFHITVKKSLNGSIFISYTQYVTSRHLVINPELLPSSTHMSYINISEIVRGLHKNTIATFSRSAWG